MTNHKVYLLSILVQYPTILWTDSELRECTLVLTFAIGVGFITHITHVRNMCKKNIYNKVALT